MADCIFCAIAAGDAPAVVVDSDDHAVAFMDINPWARGHALVIPRRHARDLLDIEPDDLGHVSAMGQGLARRMRDRLGTDGVSLWNSCGAVAGQVVFHFHLHVLPAPVDTAQLRRDAGAADSEAIAETAELLRA